MALTPSTTDELLVEQHDRVALITLNRPDRSNAISRDMLDELSKRWSKPIKTRISVALS